MKLLNSWSAANDDSIDLNIRNNYELFKKQLFQMEKTSKSMFYFLILKIQKNYKLIEIDISLH